VNCGRHHPDERPDKAAAERFSARIIEGFSQPLENLTIEATELSLPSLQADAALLYAAHAMTLRAVPW
jgi:hypothetical protein